MSILNDYLNKKVVKGLLGIFAALAISVVLTLLSVIFIPSIFTYTLNTGLDLLPKNKFVEYKVQTKTELVTQWLDASYNKEDDGLIFEQLRERFPYHIRKDTFFAHMLVIHDYPEPCFFTIVGKHRAMDIAWTVNGIRCKGVLECNDPQFIEHCPPPKRHHK